MIGQWLVIRASDNRWLAGGSASDTEDVSDDDFEALTAQSEFGKFFLIFW